MKKTTQKQPKKSKGSQCIKAPDSTVDGLANCQTGGMERPAKMHRLFLGSKGNAFTSLPPSLSIFFCTFAKRSQCLPLHSVPRYDARCVISEIRTAKIGLAPVG